MNQSKGFTLLELMVTIAVLTILLTVGVPSMKSAAEKRRTVAAAEEIYSQIQLARSEAIARSQSVFLNVVPGADWAIGISNNPACDPSDNVPACTLPDVANNNPIDHRFTANDFADVSLTATTNQITFLSQRGTATGAVMGVASTGDIGYLMAVIVRPLGQISMCSPNTDPSKYVTGYRACD